MKCGVIKVSLLQKKKKKKVKCFKRHTRLHAHIKSAATGRHSEQSAAAGTTHLTQTGSAALQGNLRTDGLATKLGR